MALLTGVKNTNCKNTTLEKKEIEKVNISLETLRPKDLRAKKTIKTDSILSPDGERSQSDTGDTPVDIEPLVVNKEIFQYSITSGKDIDLELPQIDMDFQDSFNMDFDN